MSDPDSSNLATDNGTVDKPQGTTAKVEISGGATPSMEANSSSLEWRDTEELPREFGNYQLQEVLGQGGMGRVYKALQVNAKRLVAIKIIRPDLTDGPSGQSETMVARFRLETQATANLCHENIVTIYDAGTVDGQMYYCMQLIDGDSLDELIGNGPISNTRAAAIVMGISKGVYHAHSSGILHRDIKPENVMIDRQQQSYIMDFGIAKRVGQDATGHTKTGELLGTASYMSPEQARNSEQVDVRSDVYSLGAILYFAITSRPPFQASRAVDTLRQVQSLEPVAPMELNTGVAADLSSICLKCLEKEPSQRYADASDLAEDLQRFLHGFPVRAKPISSATRLYRWSGRNKRLVAMMVLFFGFVFGVFLAASLQVRHTRIVGLIAKLENVQSNQLCPLIDQIRNYESIAKPILENKLIESGDPKNRLRYAIPFSSESLDQSSFITDENFDHQIHDLQQLLASDNNLNVLVLWDVLKDMDSDRRYWLRSASLLAISDPTSEEWSQVGEQLGRTLLELNPLEANRWLDLLQPVLHKFPAPFELAFKDKEDVSASEVASNALSRIFRSQPMKLCDLIVEATAGQFAYLIPMIRKNREPSIVYLTELTNRPVTKFQRFGPNNRRMIDYTIEGYDYRDYEIVDFPEDIEKSKIVNALITLVQLGEIGIEKTLSHSKDPVIQTMVILRFSEFGCDPEELVTILNLSNHSEIQQLDQILLTIGNFSTSYHLKKLQRECQSVVCEIFQEDARPGVHSAAEWLLSQWGTMIAVDSKDFTYEEAVNGGRDWYITPSGQSMSVIRSESDSILPITWYDSPPIVMYSEFSEPFVGHSYPFASYAVATTEVTKEQFDLFIEFDGHIPKFGPYPKCPVNFVSYNLAARYCNWLSIKDGFIESELCYEETNDTVKLAENYRQRKGYRLPTVFEWENSVAGQHDIALSNLCYWRFAWTVEKTHGPSMPVRQLFPNRYGLYDLFGNVQEICIRDGKFPDRVCTYRGGTASHSITNGRGNAHICCPNTRPLVRGGFRFVQLVETTVNTNTEQIY